MVEKGGRTTEDEGGKDEEERKIRERGREKEGLHDY